MPLVILPLVIPGSEVEFSAILRGGGACPVDRDRQSSQRLVLRLVQRAAHEVRVNQILCAFVVPSKDELPNFRQRGQRLWIRVVVRATGPERPFIQLKPLLFDTSEHHRTEPTVSDW